MPILRIEPTRDEIAAAGKYNQSMLEREDDRLQVIAVTALFYRPNKPAVRHDLPLPRNDAVKSAKAVSKDDKQGSLL